MAELLPTLSRLRAEILDDEHLVRALATGRRRGQEPPRFKRVELRYVDLKGGRHLQVVAYDETQAHTSNHAGTAAEEALDDLLGQAWGNWHVDTDQRTHQLRVTKKGEALLHTTERAEPVAPERGHDHAKQRLLPEDHPVLRALGISDAHGRVKPSRQAKYRQVEELVRALDAAVAEGHRAGTLRTPTPEDPLRVVDLGCGNAYLTFAAHAWLARSMPVRLTGVDVKEQSRRHNAEVAASLGVADQVDFVQAGIDDVELPQPPDVVLALHACDTATDDALARAVRWEADLVLAAPCCHHDVSAQLRQQPTPPGYDMLTRDGILRERLADTLTDALRASLLRLEGYRVEVAEFVDSAHTPRNTLLRAVRVRGGARPASSEYDDLVATWHLRPALAERLGRGSG
ncbi:SAM-dependent methyltransferase [Nocardioides aurantiacus]|uniref:Methyltransferase family protein n=1 Tax=Nocardioides aurantiacus TaxID=86796 RepID=A0A3N2CRB6_9ACTN|nr:SAM-dependent methyltransferase [Nocardioides aurantiacus]ROR89966.1 methyltransferase family protein [Nocardioides aurantiacus]